MTNTKHPVTHHPMGVEGWYKYRGVTIKRNDRCRGYWGHWNASIAGGIMNPTKFTTQTRAELLKQIDDHLDKPKTA